MKLLQNLQEKCKKLSHLIKNFETKYLSKNFTKKTSDRVSECFKIMFSDMNLLANARTGVSDILIKCAKKLHEEQHCTFLSKITKQHLACYFQPNETLAAFTSLMNANKLITSEKQHCTLLC